MGGPEAYCRARLDGLSDAEAATQAGYAGRTPPAARTLWERVEVLHAEPTPVSVLQAEVDKLKTKHDRIKRQLIEANRWLYAATLLANASLESDAQA